MPDTRVPRTLPTTNGDPTPDLRRSPEQASRLKNTLFAGLMRPAAPAQPSEDAGTTAAPAADAPATEVPASDVPATGASATGAPAADPPAPAAPIARTTSDVPGSPRLTVAPGTGRSAARGDETISRVQALLRVRDLAVLDGVAARTTQGTGTRVQRSEILRALVEALEVAGAADELAEHGTHRARVDFLAARLRG